MWCCCCGVALWVLNYLVYSVSRSVDSQSLYVGLSVWKALLGETFELDLRARSVGQAVWMVLRPPGRSRCSLIDSLICLPPRSFGVAEFRKLSDCSDGTGAEVLRTHQARRFPFTSTAVSGKGCCTLRCAVFFRSVIDRGRKVLSLGVWERIVIQSCTVCEGLDFDLLIACAFLGLVNFGLLVCSCIPSVCHKSNVAILWILFRFSPSLGSRTVTGG